MDIEVVGQLVDSMGDAVEQLERAVEGDDKIKANKLKAFILDLHEQIGVATEGGNV